MAFASLALTTAAVRTSPSDATAKKPVITVYKDKSFTFGSAGVGTTQQFAGELMKQTAGLNITHVPYRTTPAAVTGLRGGDVEYLFELVQPVQGQIQAGDLKAIAVTSSERNPILPDVPTFKESGMPDYDVTSWYGIAFP